MPSDRFIYSHLRKQTFGIIIYMEGDAVKVYMKKIKMIAWFTENGIPTPIKFQIDTDKQPVTIKVDQVTERSEEKLAGTRMMVYRCQSEINGNIRIYEIKFEVVKCLWYLYKM